MKISWIQLLRAIPGAKKAIEAVTGPGGVESATIWYNLIKALVTIGSACGLYVALSAEEIETVSSLLAVGVPTVLTLCDMVANVWLRMRTKVSLRDKAKEG